MGSLVKLFDGGKISTINRICSVIFPQVNRNLAESDRAHEIKRPASAFASFFREKQPALKEENPELKQTELMKLASALWSAESEFTKQQFKNEYARKMEEYKHDTKLPKRPVPPYVQFFKDNNRTLQYEYPNLIDRARKAGEMWKNLSFIDKDRYRSTYTNEVNKFNDNLSEEDKELFQQRRNAINKQRERKDIRRFGKQAMKERPKSPINNAFSMYIHEHSSEVPHDQNVFVFLGAQWRNLSEDEKLAYKQKLDVVAVKYEKELAEWQEKYDRHAK